MVILAPLNQNEETVLRQRILLPFSTEVMEFIEAFSNAILQDSQFKRFPELMAMAFWFRKANLHKISKAFEEKRARRLWLGRGVVFHVAPSNVDSLFIYSLFLSMMVGNCNIVRVSSRHTEQQDELLGVLNQLLADQKWAAVRDRLLVVGYEHQDDITAGFSAKCDVRVVWGGDETIKHLRSIPIPPSAVELSFADRFSFSVLRSSAVLETPDLGQLVHRFYNDAYWFDQMACSSIKLVGWLGAPEETAEARRLFWAALEQKVNEYPLAASQAMDKLTAEYLLAIEGRGVRLEPSANNRIRRVCFETPEEVNRELHCGSGLFYECRLNALDDLARLIVKKDQTVASYGVAAADWRRVMEQIRPKGIDRIVPVGKALEFSLIWDGFDLLREFCREVEVVEE